MEPTIEKLLQNIPFAGMGSTLERNGLIGVIRELIKANKYTVDYILNYCESVGYQRNMAEQVFEELTGLSPKLIINNNEYYNAPIYVPACTIAWGIAKTKPNVAFYVVPGSYGYSVMEKNETEAPVEVIQMATIPEAIDELKKVAKKIQTLDKIITSKLLETEDVATIANDIDQTSKPYAAVDPIFELKKNFKNKVIDVNGFEREAKKLVAEEKITVDQAEDLMAWKQDLIDEDESYTNEVLQHNEEWNQLQGTEENEEDVQAAYEQLVDMASDFEMLSKFASDFDMNEWEAYITLAKDAASEWGVSAESVLGEVNIKNPQLLKQIEELARKRNSDEIQKWINSSKKVKSMIIDDILDRKDGSNYNAKEFYDYVLTWCDDEDDVGTEIARAIESGSEEAVKKALCNYIKDQGYNPKICNYINSVNWLEDEIQETEDEYLNSFDYLYSLLVNGNITEYKNGVKELYQQGPSKLMEYMDWLEEHNINPKEALKVMKNASLKKATNIPTGNVPTEKITLADGRTFTVRYNPKEKGITTIFNEDGKEIGVDAATRLQLLRKLFHKGEPTIVNENPKTASKKVISENVSVKDLEQKAKQYEDLLKEEGYTDMKVSPNFAYGSYGFYFDWTRDDGRPGQKYTGLGTKKETLKNLELAYYELVNKIDWFMKRKSSKKVTAENMTLEDMEDEDNKTEVQKEVEKIEETPIDELLQDTTPLDYFDEEIKEDKVDTINDVVSKCITEFSDKFKDFDKYDIKILSYKTKILDPYTTSSDEMIPDNEVNADAVLQVILAVNNKADNAEVKKLLAVFSITDGKMHWTGTVRDENDKIVAFTDQGLDSIFNDEEVEEVEEVI